ncbi:MAG: Aspartyl/glutamyl-tRNA(Asn/Gln) amidotransferase subunit B [Microgenomates group bacterium GW2011_GWA2_44_7]|uniref:Aspartyl/glutamyl-tRNA(Asn/Gln) amidotransferase subunit B n=1 Tax=Candidatus Woesebacteria bacterium GW2011_GWA1_43_12 TaxID=1618557 RepID=A0A0G1CYC9_9BACT|nr:MAG: Aspartyl/glutamyl-tRNA(Asn/Gln) amidotransferase subunit B [Candidatus Woesebacteria bacterium GW2011_GWA1_43_12]KKT75891.1 MAG: Aspartyl/glutamyl-tRNA(Asn/Gln) amidotransferase subunit B [Microgenomates group bacterium GW2011_GWA2_44_7]KKT78489.1 MAG: Aspartyl/glutamyl-tRNA(Asn/Gln) amidotransferase subunit B [Microgenomates group bacterium GW2011_GWB1_44_8]
MVSAKYESVIGMEVHIELDTKSKMFCSCPSEHFGKPPNSQVCPVCLGLPGALPVPNIEAIKKTQLIGLALGCKLRDFSKFDRKNYFYPDIPKGYQISQYDMPFCYEGKLDYLTEFQVKKMVRVRRVHMEEDTAKMIHIDGASLIDFNRSGVPLVEIVSEPDIHDSQDLRDYLKALIRVIRHLDLSSCDMEKGTLRLEANVSVRKVGSNDLPKYKVEIKNVNSFRYIAHAIDYEFSRQIEILERGETPLQETRGFDENRGVTVSQRVKEEANDYRYFPEPDIPPSRFPEGYVETLRKQISQLPQQAAERLKLQYNFSDHYVNVLTNSPEVLMKFDRLVASGSTHDVSPDEIANAIVNRRVDISLPVEQIIQKFVSAKVTTVTTLDISTHIKEVINENPKAIEDYKKGKKGAIEFLVGRLMAKLKGRMDPVSARKILEQTLQDK